MSIDSRILCALPLAALLAACSGSGSSNPNDPPARTSAGGVQRHGVHGAVRRVR